ncbi:hypothetical protein Droror1_Dr00014955 [Drosera rotundifolia]
MYVPLIRLRIFSLRPSPAGVQFICPKPFSGFHIHFHQKTRDQQASNFLVQFFLNLDAILHESISLCKVVWEMELVFDVVFIWGIRRRQSEIYHHHHLSSIQGNPVSITSIKVELKQFVLSILDDPVVSRVFGKAGFRSCDIKLAIIHPPSEFGAWSDGMLPFPFDPNRDEYCKRIGEVMIRKNGRNPVLVGVGGSDVVL